MVQKIPCFENSVAAFSAALNELKNISRVTVLMRDRPEQFSDLDELDLLVSKVDLPQVILSLRQQGWEPIRCGIISPCKWTLGLLCKGRMLYLDVHYSLVQDGLVYGDAAWFISKSHEDKDGFYQPSPEALLLHLIFHVVLGKTSLADKHRITIQNIMRDTPNLDEVRHQARRFGLGKIIDEVLVDPVVILGEATRVAELRRRSVRALLAARPANIARVVQCWWARTLGPLFGVRKGFTIAVIGPDGAGKTTFITEFRRQLLALGLPVREVYMGPWDRSILLSSKFLEWLGASPRDHIPGTESCNKTSVRTVKFIKGIIKRYCYYYNILLEFWSRYLIMVYPRMLRGRIVIMDRFIYDLEVGYKNTILRNGQFIRRCLVALSPRPRLCLLLANDPHTIWLRKREDRQEDIILAMAAYKSIAEKRKIPIVMTTVEAPELVSQFISDHWRDFLRWRLDGRLK